MIDCGNATRYLLARYIPDLQRGETRNIGVIVWSTHGVTAQFLAEKPSGEIDGRRIPDFVSSDVAYRQWIHYWRRQLETESFSPPGHQQPVKSDSPAFVDALISSSKGNFVLENGGCLLDRVTEADLSPLTAMLFNSLVEESHVAEDSHERKLKKICDGILREANLLGNPYFRDRVSVSCPIGKVVEEFVFSYAYETSKIVRLYQRIPIPRIKRYATLGKNIDAAAWMFEKVVNAHIVNQDQTAALVDVAADQVVNPETENALRILGSVTRVINVKDKQAALEEFEAVAALKS